MTRHDSAAPGGSPLAPSLAPSGSRLSFPHGNAARLLDAIEREPPPWADETIRPWDEDRFERIRRFTRCKRTVPIASIGIDRIAGTCHPDYQGRTWREMLRIGKRMPLNLAEYDRNPGYYESPAPKDITLVSTNGREWWIREGNHRVCIARFHVHYRDLHFLHGVRLIEWIWDRAAFQAFEALESSIAERGLPWYLDVTREPNGETRRNTEHLEFYIPRIVLQRRGESPEVLSAEAAIRLARRVSRPWWRRLFPAWGAR